jgi:hypothetical protein
MSQVSEAELRAMIRDAIARHSGDAPKLEEPNPAVAFARAHPSHLRLHLSRGDDGDGACLIEPAVRCSHCNFCQSFGH